MTRRTLTGIAIAARRHRRAGSSHAAPDRAGAGARCRCSRSTRRGRKLPNNWVLGQTPGIAVDRRDHVYILHRPRTVPEELRSRAAPAVLEFDEKGAFVNGVGRAGDGLRLARQRARHLRRLARTTSGLAAAARRRNSLTRRSDDMLREVHAAGQVPPADWRARQEQGQRRHQLGQQACRCVRLSEDERAVRCRRLRQPPRHRVRRRDRRLQADVGRHRQSAGRCAAATPPAARGTGAAPPAAPNPNAGQCGTLLAHRDAGARRSSAVRCTA